MLQRLQKIIAQAGIASRRHAEELIRSGQVRVNGEIVTELGSKADPEHDRVEVAGRVAEISDEQRLHRAAQTSAGRFDHGRSRRPQDSAPFSARCCRNAFSQSGASITPQADSCCSPATASSPRACFAPRLACAKPIGSR
jgi:ribosomal 50S subunit-recycling heat shock protein